MTAREPRPARRPRRPHQATSDSPQDPVSSLARLFELASRSLHSAGFANGLFPAQWTTLRYLADAPELARTSAHLARFQQIAIGPVSRTVRTLIAKGLVNKAGQGAHHRSELLALTPDGMAMLAHDPLRRVATILETLTAEEHRQLGEILVRITASLHSADGDESHLTLHP